MLWLHCNRCSEKPAKFKELLFFVTNCGHVYCKPCMEICWKRSACDVCSCRRIQCTEVNAKMKADIKSFFDDVKASLAGIHNAVKFHAEQYQHLVSSLRRRIALLEERKGALEGEKVAWLGERQDLLEGISHVQLLLEQEESENVVRDLFQHSSQPQRTGQFSDIVVTPTVRRRRRANSTCVLPQWGPLPERPAKSLTPTAVVDLPSSCPTRLSLDGMIVRNTDVREKVADWLKTLY